MLLVSRLHKKLIPVRSAPACETFLHGQCFTKYSHKEERFLTLCSVMVGPGSVVGTATRYGPDCPGFEPWWGDIFQSRSDRPSCTVYMGSLFRG